MHSTAHVAASALLYRRESGWPFTTAIVLGALTPDLPMFGFYAYEKFWIGATEKQIWSTLYFDESWQLFFDAFNSLPLAVGALFVCWQFQFRWGAVFAGSMLLHLACDLPLHHDDAHRHFLPLSDWRFASPISYWDPKHHGLTVAALELIFAVGACVYLRRPRFDQPLRVVATTTLAIYGCALAGGLIWLLRVATR